MAGSADVPDSRAGSAKRSPALIVVIVIVALCGACLVLAGLGAAVYRIMAKSRSQVEEERRIAVALAVIAVAEEAYKVDDLDGNGANDYTDDLAALEATGALAPGSLSSFSRGGWRFEAETTPAGGFRIRAIPPRGSKARGMTRDETGSTSFTLRTGL